MTETGKSDVGGRKSEYVELHCHSAFSLLDGASLPETLVERAAELRYPALALTDHDELGGSVRFAEAGREHGVHAIIGAKLTVGDAHLVLLAENREGYGNLSELITLARKRAPKGEYRLTPHDLSRMMRG